MEERRKWSPEQKLQIVLEGMHGDRSVSEVCRKYGVTDTQFYTWKDKLMKSAGEIFRRKKNDKATTKELRLITENDRMKSVIAEITAENLDLKKGDWP